MVKNATTNAVLMNLVYASAHAVKCGNTVQMPTRKVTLKAVFT